MDEVRIRGDYDICNCIFVEVILRYEVISFGYLEFIREF